VLACEKLFSTTFKGVNKAEKPDRKPYYPYGFRNPYKTVSLVSLP
jgi:hypothetical protein